MAVIRSLSEVVLLVYITSPSPGAVTLDDEGTQCTGASVTVRRPWRSGSAAAQPARPSRWHPIKHCVGKVSGWCGVVGSSSPASDEPPTTKITSPARPWCGAYGRRRTVPPVRRFLLLCRWPLEVRAVPTSDLAGDPHASPLDSDTSRCRPYFNYLL